VFFTYVPSFSPGYLCSNFVDHAYVVRPVVSLNPEAEVTNGTKTASSPYTISL